MSRLFSPFLDGLPGVGLLLLRWTLACGLFLDAAAKFTEPASWQILPTLAESLIAALLVIGLWTPLTGTAVGLLQLGMALTSEETCEPSLQRAAMGLGLALLGPGIWSLDARLFGRRRVVIENLRDD